MKTTMLPHITIIPLIEKWTLGKNSAVNYLSNYIQKQQLATTEIPDLKSIGLPIGRDPKQEKELTSLVKKISASSGILIVTSEFKGEYPTTLKNLVNFFYEQWNHKPIAICTVSDDEESSSQIINTLQFSLWKVNTYTVPVSFHVPGKIEASRSSDMTSLAFETRQAIGFTEENEFQQAFDKYCNKYIQLCTRIEYAV